MEITHMNDLLNITIRFLGMITFNFIMFSFTTLIWVSFDYSLSYRCVEKQNCFQAYVQDRTMALVANGK